LMKKRINVSFNSVETSLQKASKPKKGDDDDEEEEEEEEEPDDSMDIDSEFGPIVEDMRIKYGCGVKDVLSVDIFDLKRFKQRGAVVSFTSPQNRDYNATFPDFNVATQRIDPKSCVTTIICKDSYLKGRILARKRKRDRSRDTLRRGPQKAVKKSRMATPSQSKVSKKGGKPSRITPDPPPPPPPPPPVSKDKFETLKTGKGLTYVLGCWIFKCCVNYFKFKNQKHKDLVIKKMNGKVNAWNEYRVKLRALKKSPKKSYDLLFASDHELLAHIIEYVASEHRGAKDLIKLWFDQVLENPGNSSPTGVFQKLQVEIITQLMDLIKSLHEEYREQIFELNEGLYLFGD